MKLLSFELKKVMFNKKFIIIMTLIIAMIAFLFLRNLSLQDFIKEEERKAIEANQKVSYENREIHDSVLEKTPKNEEELLLQSINQSMIESLREMTNASFADDWQSKLKAENIYLAYVREYREADGEHPILERNIEKTLAMNHKLLDENIPPQHEKYSIAFPNFMKQVVDLFTHLGAIIIMILLLGEILTSEFEQQSIKFLFTQPIKKTSVITSKLMTSIILYLFTTGIVLLTIAIIGIIFAKEGTFAYPVLIEKGSAIDFISISDYMVQVLIGTTATLLMVLSLYLLYSLLFKHLLASLSVLLVTLLGGYSLTKVIPWSSFAWINPFQYLLPSETILNVVDFWHQGIPILILLTIVIYLVSIKKIKSSEIG